MKNTDKKTNNIIEITDFSASELDVYARLTENQLLNRAEPEKGVFIAESPKVIERALSRLHTSILSGGKKTDREWCRRSTGGAEKMQSGACIHSRI